MDQKPVGNIEFVMCHMASPVRSLLEGKRFLATGGGAGDNMFEPAAETWADPIIAGGGYALAQMTHSAGMAYWLTGLKADTVFAYNSAPNGTSRAVQRVFSRFRGWRNRDILWCWSVAARSDIPTRHPSFWR